MKKLISQEGIHQKIFLIRGHKVMLSTHLAELYGVEVRSLVQVVKRNKARFPADFMFQLTDSEWENLKSQFVISSWGGARRANPYAFTEHSTRNRFLVPFLYSRRLPILATFDPRCGSKV